MKALDVKTDKKQGNKKKNKQVLQLKTNSDQRLF